MTSPTKLAKQVEDLKDDIKQRTEEALDEAFDDLERQMEFYLRMNNAMATRFLFQSIESSEGELDDPMAYAAQRITAASYWAYVEFGTGIYTSAGRSYPSAGIPPYVPIYRWVVAKRLKPDENEEADTQEEIAYAIQHSMSEGTPQQKFARPAWRGPRGKQHVVNKVEDALNAALNNF